MGTYFVPSIEEGREALERRYRTGPVGFVHITSQGRPVHDTSIMAKGLALDMLSALALAVLMRMAAPALPTHGRRATFAALSCVAAALLIDGGDVAWWSIPWRWKLQHALYDASTWCVDGPVLARFVHRR